MERLYMFLMCYVFITGLKIGHTKTLYLNTGDVSWTLQTKSGSAKVRGNVPGSSYADLQSAGVIEPILAWDNDVKTRWVAREPFIYSTTFYLNESDIVLKNGSKLVLEGVDTVAFVELNDSPVGSTDNMFVRYSFDVTNHLKTGLNNLKVTFESPIEAAKHRSDQYFTVPDCVPKQYNGECHVNQLRKMQASFGWDWGPAFPSVGLWKSVSLELFEAPLIRYLTTSLTNDKTTWVVKVKVYLEYLKKKRIMGTILSTLKTNAEKVTVENDVIVDFDADGTGEAELMFEVSENLVSLWWPNGFGYQPLYEFTVELRRSRYPEQTSKKTIHIGFRTIELVEEDALSVLGDTPGGKGLTFYFKVNGYPLFMKGTNWIPANILPDLAGNEETIDELLESAQDVHMSMLRVWGGGMYESDYFYSKCDQLGILVWQDFMFACSMYPVDADFLASVQEEIRQNVLRIQHHPSIAIWAGNNENEAALRGDWYPGNFNKLKAEYIKLYVDTIKPIVENFDPDRRYLVSSPSNGVQSEIEGYIALDPYDAHYGDVHFYNYMANNWEMDIYPKTRFASEYGLQSMPSLSTFTTATHNPEDLDISSYFMKHRQHLGSGYFLMKEQISFNMNLTGNEDIEDFIYYSQISQAMAIKTETEFYRQSQEDWYTMGALYWQLNDVWQAPSWSSIDFGGKWKMLHYFAWTFFAPVLVSPRLHTYGNIDVYILNDKFVPILNASVQIDTLRWGSMTPIYSDIYSNLDVNPLSAKKVLSIQLKEKKDAVFLRFTLKAYGVALSPVNYLFPTLIVEGLKKPIITITVTARSSSVSSWQYDVQVTVNTVVLFLWLDTTVPGRFDDNGLIITQPVYNVSFHAKNYVKTGELQQSIKYKYYLP